jgi:hypothetical protein
VIPDLNNPLTPETFVTISLDSVDMAADTTEDVEEMTDDADADTTAGDMNEDEGGLVEPSADAETEE